MRSLQAVAGVPSAGSDGATIPGPSASATMGSASLPRAAAADSGLFLPFCCAFFFSLPLLACAAAVAGYCRGG